MNPIKLLSSWLFYAAIHEFSAPPAPTSPPIVVYAGLGDSVLSDGMQDFMAELADRYSTQVYGISVADTVDQDRRLSGLSDANDNVAVACQKLSRDLDGVAHVNAVGLSQGGLFLRAIIEQCNDIPQFDNLVTFGTPHMGVERLLQCSPRDWVCHSAQLVTKWGVYSDYAQHHAVVAQYYRDPVRYATYLDKSTWLATLNNERILLGNDEYDATYGDRLASLDGFTAVMFDEDTVVNPRQSAWFASSPVSSEYAAKDDIVALEEQPIYTHPRDPLGLRRLNEDGRLHLKSCAGQHLHLTDDCLWPILDDAFT